MFRKTALLLAVLLAPAVLAANSDLRVSMDGIPDRIAPGATIEWTVSFTNASLEPFDQVWMHAEISGYPPCVDRTARLAAGETQTVHCTTTLSKVTPPYSANASAGIWSQFNLDPNYNDNSAYRQIQFDTNPDLRIFFGYPYPTYPGLPFTVDVSYTNVAYTIAQDVIIAFDVPAALSVRALTPNCTAEGTHVTCYAGDVLAVDSPNLPRTFRVEVVAPDASAMHYQATASIYGSSIEQAPGDNHYTVGLRTYTTNFVTNVNDSGEGSLRAAIDATNASCPGECLVAFRIPNLAGVATIQPATPLPVVTTQDVLIDGLTQALYFADSNPAGPEIELRGSNLTAGDGLVLATACQATVKGLAINGFPRHGIYATAGRSCGAGSFFGPRIIQQNYLGVDATGTTAVPNFRGIYSDGGTASIGRNVISGNTRAGVSLVSGPSFVTGNTIGLDPTGTKPLGNGASGIYIGPAAGGTDVTRNHIAFNADAGVSIDAAATYVNVYQNAIHANHQIAVDFGLDGPTPALPIAAPDVTAAQYDAATNTTTISIATAAGARFTWIDVYANDAADPSGFGEGQTYLGQAKSTSQGLRFVYPGDLRGKWIAAQGVYQIITTFSHEPPVHSEAHGPYADTTSSEFGRAFQVMP